VQTRTPTKGQKNFPMSFILSPIPAPKKERERRNFIIYDVILKATNTRKKYFLFISSESESRRRTRRRKKKRHAATREAFIQFLVCFVFMLARLCKEHGKSNLCVFVQTHIKKRNKFLSMPHAHTQRQRQQQSIMNFGHDFAYSIRVFLYQ
jgi:hypothetical protein